MAEHSGGISSTDYISHHLTNLHVGEGFWTWHIDTLFFSLLTAGLMAGVAYVVGKNIDPDKPTGLQNLVEILLEFVEKQVKEMFDGYNPIVGPFSVNCVCMDLPNERNGLIPC